MHYGKFTVKSCELAQSSLRGLARRCRTRGDCVAARGAALGSDCRFAAVLLRAGGRECAGMDGVGARLLRRGRRARRGQSRACKINIVKCAVTGDFIALLHTERRRVCKIYILHVKFTFYKM